jgi:hypothetical protein
MVARSPSPWTNDADHSDREPAIGPSPSRQSYEPVRPAEGVRQQAIRLTPPPGKLYLLVGAVVSGLIGGAVGFWLGSRRAPKRTNPIGNIASTVGSAVELAPVAMQLLSNPLVRSIAVRILLRQLAQRVER